MIEFTPAQSDLVISTSKIVSWLFNVEDKNGVTEDKNGVPFKWSTKNVTFDGTTYTFKVTSFAGVTIARPKTEMGIMSPSTLNFTISNKDHVISVDDLEGGNVTLILGMSNAAYTDTEILTWKFFIKKADAYYQQIVIQCEDFFQQYLEGNFPILELSREEGSVVWDATEFVDDLNWQI